MYLPPLTMAPATFQLTPKLKQAIQPELEAHWANPYQKNNKTNIARVAEKLVSLANITDEKGKKGVTKVSHPTPPLL